SRVVPGGEAVAPSESGPSSGMSLICIGSGTSRTVGTAAGVLDSSVGLRRSAANPPAANKHTNRTATNTTRTLVRGADRRWTVMDDAPALSKLGPLFSGVRAQLGCSGGE